MGVQAVTGAVGAWSEEKAREVSWASRVRGTLGLLAELSKARIAVASTLTAGAGFLLHDASSPGALFLVLLGVLLLASGACALNEVQEWRLDARMRRTASRPVPSGRMTPRAAGLSAAAMVSGGLVLVLTAGGTEAAVLGVLAVLWYNGVYTPLKRFTAFAVVPGAFIGALPPLVGYAGAGGSALDPQALALALFFFVWQIPHFWFLALIYGEDYAAAGYPTLGARMGTRNAARFVFAWTSLAALAAGLMPLFGVAAGAWAWGALLAASVWLMIKAWPLLGADPVPGPARKAFLAINLYALAVTALVTASALAG